jgi:hypothetical protein
MKRFSLILASLVLVFGAKASAHSGGPFGNGDYSELLDNSGIYQVAFRFSNGSGFAQFGNNVDTSAFTVTGGGAGATQTQALTINNRSIIYYKGVTFLGTCFGMVDHERKTVSGVTNGNSDVLTTTAVNTTPVGGGLPGAVNNAQQTLLNNGNTGMPCNTEFICKITKTYPVLRFNGKGELTVINPSLATTISAQLAAALAGIVAPSSDITPPPAGADDVNPVQPTATAIQNYANAINNLTAALTGSIPSVEQIRRTSDHVPMIVFGSRIFFTSERR